MSEERKTPRKKLTLQDLPEFKLPFRKPEEVKILREPANGAGALRVELEELLRGVKASIHPQVRALAEKEKTEALVLLRVLALDSSRYGHQQILAVGKNCTYQLENVLKTGFHLGDVPSRFYYPIAYAIVKEKADD